MATEPQDRFVVDEFYPVATLDGLQRVEEGGADPETFRGQTRVLFSERVHENWQNGVDVRVESWWRMRREEQGDERHRGDLQC